MISTSVALPDNRLLRLHSHETKLVRRRPTRQTEPDRAFPQSDEREKRLLSSSLAGLFPWCCGERDCLRPWAAPSPSEFAGGYVLPICAQSNEAPGLAKVAHEDAKSRPGEPPDNHLESR